MSDTINVPPELRSACCGSCPCDTALPVTILGLDKLPNGSTVSISIVIGGKPPEPRTPPAAPPRIYAGTAQRS